MIRPLALPLALCALIVRGQAGALPSIQSKPSDSLPQTYKTIRDWAEVPGTHKRGADWPAAVTAVEPAPDGSVYVVFRCYQNSCKDRPEDPILKYDANGKLLRSWGAGMFIFPHGATVDAQGNLWVADAGGANGKGHQVFQFSPEGKLLRTLGKAGAAGEGADTFNQPTDVAVSPRGEIYVADGHRNTETNATGNNRIVRFSKDGKYLGSFGRTGSGPGELKEPHSLAFDSTGRLFVADRVNNRISIFEPTGKFIAHWTQFGRPSGISITRDDRIYVTDSECGPDSGAGELTGWRRGIRIGSARDGKVTGFIEDMEPLLAEHSGAEGVGVDSAGNVYGAIVRRKMLEKHLPVPNTMLSNGAIHAVVMLPDVEKGYYRGTRFDWSGMVSSLEFAGHSYFGQWFTRMDPAVRDVTFDADNHGYSAGPVSAALGPIEEFNAVSGGTFGFEEAKPGETFLKIGVGALRKPRDGAAAAKYDRYFPYELADPGRWKVASKADHVEFVHTASSSTGYAYEYRKIVRLIAGKPQMRIEHWLKNTGAKAIEASVYNHNFFVIDRQTPGPRLALVFPWEVTANRPLNGMAEVQGTALRYTKALEDKDLVATGFTGFGPAAKDNEFRVENGRTGAGVRVRGDQPLERMTLWSIPRVLAPEAFMRLRAEPGKTVEWSLTYDFYTLPETKGAVR